MSLSNRTVRRRTRLTGATTLPQTAGQRHDKLDPTDAEEAEVPVVAYLVLSLRGLGHGNQVGAKIHQVFRVHFARWWQTSGRFQKVDLRRGDSKAPLRLSDVAFGPSKSETWRLLSRPDQQVQPSCRGHFNGRRKPVQGSPLHKTTSFNSGYSLVHITWNPPRLKIFGACAISHSRKVHVVQFRL